jgi:5-formyltetrahydrofolate cyclo-ligase
VAASSSPAGLPLRDAKRALRQRIIAARDAMPVAARDDASRRISNALLARPDLSDARTVLATFPFGSEWDTRPLIEALLDRGKVVVAPRVNAMTRMIDLFVIANAARDIVPGYRGIPEPGIHCTSIAADEIDWILVPGVAFDADGRRLGYGGGFYDRLLPHARRDARRIAGAFDLQIVESVPAAPHDLSVEAIVTEERLLSIAA